MPLQLFGAELPFDLELAQLAEEGAFFRGETIGFTLQRLQPLGRPPRERLGARALRGLGGCDRPDDSDNRGERRDRREYFSLRALRASAFQPAPSPEPRVP